MKINPLTRQRWRRFRKLRRAWVSLWILAALYVLSLGAEFLCHSEPIWVRYAGRSYFPIWRYYAEDVFTGSGRLTRPDYRQIAASAAFRSDPGNRMLFPLLRYGPLESVPAEAIAWPERVRLELESVPLVGVLSVQADLRIVQATAVSAFCGRPDRELLGQDLSTCLVVTDSLRQALAKRFANQTAPAESLIQTLPGGLASSIALATFAPRAVAPQRVRLLLREASAAPVCRETLLLTDEELSGGGALWAALPEATQAMLLQAARQRQLEPVASTNVLAAGRMLAVHFSKDEIRYPLRPVPGHPLGLDSAGRDVLARILYGLRISLSFGLLLVLASMAVGIFIGALQGYQGGALDLVGQRLIEIWDALPFLYIIILMGSVFGRSFGLLLFCYALFNWVGISYYQRAEFLRLRKAAFVEAARCLGVSRLKIMFRHILPNALVPVITFFPFALVGAIGLLAALDYLGFGLPPPTPSWGELLTQAQEYGWAWWLALFPALALFSVMLLGVFIGEGVRSAFDPRPVVRLE